MVEGAVRLVAGARAFQGDVAADEIYDIGGCQYLLYRFLWNEAHGSACFPGVVSTAESFIELIPLLAADDVADAAPTATETRMILIALDVKAVVEGQFLALFDISERVNVNAFPGLPCLAIRLTGVIDEAGNIPRKIPVDVVFLADCKNINGGLSVELRALRLIDTALAALVLIDKFADIFDDLLLRRDVTGGIYAATMNFRVTHLAEFALPTLPYCEHLFVKLSLADL